MANPRTNRNEIVQVNNYYPFGGIIDEGSRRGADVQNHLYNGKELDRMHGLNLYDYSARQYDAAIGQFTSMDPLCEKYYHISPYTYCAGNPVNAVGPSGKLFLFINGKIGGGAPKAGESYWNGRNSSFVEGAGHEVLIVGYNTYGLEGFVCMDPFTGTYETHSPEDFHDLYMYKYDGYATPISK